MQDGNTLPLLPSQGNYKLLNQGRKSTHADISIIPLYYSITQMITLSRFNRDDVK